MSSVLTGFEGLVTPAQLTAQRAKTRRAQVLQAGQLESGLDFGARSVGLLIGSIIQRQLPPGEKEKRVAAADEIVTDAQTRVSEQTFDGELASFDQRIAVVNTAIKGLVDKGLTAEADQLRSNLVSLRNQRFEQRVELAKLAGTEAETANKIQTNEFNELGDAATITFPGQPDPITVMQLPDGTAKFTDPQTGLERELQPGQYTTVSVRGGVDDVSPDRVLIRAAIKKMNAMHGLVNIGRQMRRAIVDNPASTTFTGPVASALNQASINARAFITKNEGVKVDIENRGRIDKVLGELNVQQGVMKSRASQIAFAIATSREGGRLTDQDVERAATAAGFGQTDPAVRIAVLDSLLLDTQSEFEFLGKNPDIKSLPQFEALTEDFTAFGNDRRDFSVIIPGREGEKPREDNDPIFTSPSGVKVF